jgi:hypothetical protein
MTVSEKCTIKANMTLTLELFLQKKDDETFYVNYKAKLDRFFIGSIPMGGLKHRYLCKNKKGTEISPLLAF